MSFSLRQIKCGIANKCNYSPHSISDLIFCCQKYFINTMPVHIDDFKFKSPPFQFITCSGDTFQFIEDKTGKRIKLPLAFIDPVCLFKERKKIIKRNLSV